jgi:hypothetical protein
VFAFAATLLVLDLAVKPPGGLEQVLQAWLAHTALTDRLAHTDPIFLRLNLLLLPSADGGTVRVARQGAAVVRELPLLVEDAQCPLHGDRA